MRSWLIENASLSDGLIFSAAADGIMSFATAKELISGKLTTQIWLVTVGSKRLYCGFIDTYPNGYGRADGPVKFGALLNLPVVASRGVQMIRLRE